MIETIQKVDVVEKIFEQIKRNIANGTWEPGQKIPSETELSKQFNVSRNSIRSAIQKLKAMGVLSTRQGSGTVVCSGINSLFSQYFVPFIPLSKEEMAQILEFRSVMEVEAIRLAALRADQEDIENLRHNLDNMFLSLNDYKKYTMADFQFHLSILRASKNMIFYNVIMNLEDVILSSIEELNSDVACKLETNFETHKQIFEAISNKDYEMAMLVAKRNFERNNEFLYTKQGISFKKTS